MFKERIKNQRCC